MKKLSGAILLTTVLSVFMSYGEELDSTKVFDSVATEVSADKSQVVDIVTNRSAASPEFVREIVKSAIIASEADIPTVVAIVQAAIAEVPAKWQMISRSAIAVAPDAYQAVEEFLSIQDQVAYTGKDPRNHPSSIIQILGLRFNNLVDLQGRTFIGVNPYVVRSFIRFRATKTNYPFHPSLPRVTYPDFFNRES